MNRYEVEKSSDGNHFAQSAIVEARENAAAGESNYTCIDSSPVSGDNFYRVKAVGNSGEVRYSNMVSVRILHGTSSVNVYPNPLQGKIISVVMTDIPKGNYPVKLVNDNGQTVYSSAIQHDDTSAVHSLRLFKALSKGIYRLQIQLADRIETASIIVQ